jgi:integrase
MLGQLVGRYLRWFRNEYGATPSTLRDHEAVLGRMSIMLADKEPIDVSVDDLRDVIDLWGERSPRTRQKVTSVVRAFWSWAEEQGHIAISPAARIRRPRAEKRVAPLLPADARPRLLTIAKHPRDRLALFCLLLLGVRRGELARIQVRDFDAQRCSLRVYGRVGRSGCFRSAGPSSPSSGFTSAPTSLTSADCPSRTTTSSTRRRRSTPDAAPRASRSSPCSPTRRSSPARRPFIAGGIANSKRRDSSAAGSRTG